MSSTLLLILLGMASLYGGPKDDGSMRLAADASIAKALRFRAASVKKLPAQKKAGYLELDGWLTQDGISRRSATAGFARALRYSRR